MEELNLAISGLLQAIAGLAIAYITKKIRDYVNSIRDEKARKALLDAVIPATNWATNQFGSGKTPTRAEVASNVVLYLYDHFPEYIKMLGLDRESVRSLVEARL